MLIFFIIFFLGNCTSKKKRTEESLTNGQESGISQDIPQDENITSENILTQKQIIENPQTQLHKNSENILITHKDFYIYRSKLEQLVDKYKWFEFMKEIKRKPSDIKIYDIIRTNNKNSILHRAAYNGCINIVIIILEQLKKELKYNEEKHHDEAQNKIIDLLLSRNIENKNILELAQIDNIPLKPISDLVNELSRYINTPNIQNTLNRSENDRKKETCNCFTIEEFRRDNDNERNDEFSSFEPGLNILLKCNTQYCGKKYWISLGYGNFYLGSLIPSRLLCNFCQNNNIDEESPSLEKIIICHANMDYHIKYIEKKQTRSNSDKKLNHKVNHLQQLEIDFDSEYKYFEIKLRSLD